MLGFEANKLNGWKSSVYVLRDVHGKVGFVSERARTRSYPVNGFHLKTSSELIVTLQVFYGAFHL
jgi:uncharacterized protein YraI